MQLFAYLLSVERLSILKWTHPVRKTRPLSWLWLLDVIQSTKLLKGWSEGALYLCCQACFASASAASLIGTNSSNTFSVHLANVSPKWGAIWCLWWPPLMSFCHFTDDETDEHASKSPSRSPPQPHPEVFFDAQDENTNNHHAVFQNLSPHLIMLLMTLKTSLLPTNWSCDTLLSAPNNVPIAMQFSKSTFHTNNVPHCNQYLLWTLASI